MPDVRQLPAVDERVETGVVQFGDDWPGLFLRGDDAGALMLCMRHAAAVMKARDHAADWATTTTFDRLADLIEREVMVK